MMLLLSGSSYPSVRLHPQGMPAPHWQPSSSDQALSGWFSHTQPIPRHFGQLLFMSPQRSARPLLRYAAGIPRAMTAVLGGIRPSTEEKHHQARPVPIASRRFILTTTLDVKGVPSTRALV